MLLLNNKQQSIKKSNTEKFNVPTRYFDGADFCELVDVYLLY